MSFVKHKSQTGITSTGFFSGRNRVCETVSSSALKSDEKKPFAKNTVDKRAGVDMSGFTIAAEGVENTRPGSRCGFATGSEV
jgi:hypothetical protein